MHQNCSLIQNKEYVKPLNPIKKEDRFTCTELKSTQFQLKVVNFFLPMVWLMSYQPL